MRIVPDSTVNLYGNVDIDMGSGVQIAFSSIANQRTYFNSKLVRTNTPCTVIKKTGRLRLEVTGSVVSGCNYISFVNPSFDNKTIYARITDYEYINNECTEISYLIDFWQTWMFDVSFEKCGIARQYLNETDFNKAATNPYDPTIYAFQTPEDLAYDRTLEKPGYAYQASTVYPSGRVKDGEYVVASRSLNTASDLPQFIQGEENSLVIFLSPIDFNDLGSSAETNWSNFIDDVVAAGGRYISPGDVYSGSDIIISNMPRGYEIIQIPQFNSTTTADLFADFVAYMTGWNAINQIIGVYAIPTYVFNMALVDSGTAIVPQWSRLNTDNIITVKTSDKRTKDSEASYNPHCKKLLTFPYSYLRAETTDGSTKEYHYEDFSEVYTGSSTNCKFRLYCDLNGNPTFFIAPYAYHDLNVVGTAVLDSASVDCSDLASFNISERIEIADFPQVPFITDTYLTYLSKEYMANVANNNLETQDTMNAKSMQNKADLLTLFASPIEEGINAGVGASESTYINPAGGVTEGSGFTKGLTNYALNRNQVAYYNARLEEAQTMLAGHANGFQRLANGTQEHGRFNDTRPAFANNTYHPGTQSGKLQFIKGMLPIDIKLTHVQLKTKILQKYDEYFKTFGYNVAGEIDIPYVIKYTQGASSNDDVPHWEQVNGKDSTYVRTQDCHVTHSMLPVSMTIEAMFNSGVRMLKGETL